MYLLSKYKGTLRDSHCERLYSVGGFISFTDTTLRDINYALIALLSGELKGPLHYDCCCICHSYRPPLKTKE